MRKTKTMKELDFISIKGKIRKEEIDKGEISDLVDKKIKEINDNIPYWEGLISEINNCEHNYSAPRRYKVVSFSGRTHYKFEKTCINCGFTLYSIRNAEYPEPKNFKGSIKQNDIPCDI